MTLIQNSGSAALLKKWKPLLESEDFDKIDTPHKAMITAVAMENTEKALREDRSGNTLTAMLGESTYAGTGGFTSGAAAAGPVAGYDPILISMVRRAMPNLIAYDVCGVQPMTGPAGLIFAMHTRYGSQTGAEAFYNEADTDFSGTGTHAGVLGQANTAAITTGTGMSTGDAELRGTGGANPAIAEMSFAVSKVTVEAKSRMLKAEWSVELAQDMKNVQGLDAEVELTNILGSQIIADINREVIRSIYVSAVQGATATTAPGIFDLDVDANGRWSEEKFKGLILQIDFEANAIAKATRLGKGNIVICSSNVASALSMAGALSYAPVLASKTNLAVDDTGNTFAGVLNGRYKVYIDPYAGDNYVVVGYKGASALDAGLFYCPYVPLMLTRAVNDQSYQPRIAFRTRYGMVANPYAQGGSYSNGAITANTNQYYRRFAIANLL